MRNLKLPLMLATILVCSASSAWASCRATVTSAKSKASGSGGAEESVHYCTIVGGKSLVWPEEFRNMQKAKAELLCNAKLQQEIARGNCLKGNVSIEEGMNEQSAEGETEI